ARFGTVAVLTKRARDESNTKWAQGGIAAVLDPQDSFASHVADTLESGAGLCKLEAVEMCVRDGPERVRELQALGARFAYGDRGDLDLTREGAHSARRVVHAEDMTGREVERTLLAACDGNDNITFFPDHSAIDLVLSARAGQGGPSRVLGAWVLEERTGKVES